MDSCMPNQNHAKVNIKDKYYYVYTPNDSNRQIFFEESDYWFFFSLFEKFLSKVDPPKRFIKVDQSHNGSVEVLAYCMMPNRLYLIVYHDNQDEIKKLLDGIMKSYSRYFNKKYNHNKQSFSINYITSRILTDERLLHISRRVHLNPVSWIDYPYSSLSAYLYDDAPCWINKKRISKLYGSAVEYLTFLKDYQSDKSSNK